MSEVQTTLQLKDQASSVLQKVANTAKQTASQMQQTGRSIDQAFRSNSPNTFASQAGSAINSVVSYAEKLGNTIANLFDGSDMNAFGDEFDAKFQEASMAAEEFRQSVSEAGKAIEEVTKSSEELGDSVDDIGNGGKGLDDVGQDAAKAGQEMEQASGKALNLGNALKTMAAAIGVAKIAGEVKQFVSESISLGTGYTAMMSEVAAISGATGAEYGMLEQTAREYGATTVFSASESAEALKYMSLAGWDANQSASALGGVLNLAAASGMGLGQASDMVTDYLSAFGMEADRAGYFADMLAYAQANSNTSAQQLGQAYLNSAANLHAAGQDIETTTSLLEAMANQGTKGSRAGTQLAAITRDITNQMENGAIQIGKTSVAVQDQYGNFRDLTDILTDVESAVDGLGSAERAAALAETFTADSTKGVNQILTEGMDNIARYEEELRRSTGSAEQAADIMNDNLKGDMANMNSAFEEMQLQVFEGLEGNLRTGAQYVTSTIIPALTEWVPEAIGTVGDSIAKVGNAVAPLFTTLLKNPKAVGTALASLGSFFGVMKAASIGNNISNTVNKMGGLAGVVDKLGTTITAHPWALGAAAVVAGIVAIKGAVDQYNAIQVEQSLQTHFGSIELSDADAAEMAGKIIGVDWVADINLALGEFKNAEQFHQEAEEALQSNAELLWKAAVQTQLNHTGEDPVGTYVDGIQADLDAQSENSGLTYETNVPLSIEFTTEMAEDFKTNIQNYLESKRAELESITFASKTSMETVLGDKAGEAMIAQMQTWAAEDTAELSTLSESLTQLVQDALEDGVLDVEEQAAIDILQSKINSILTGWQQAQADAEWQTLQQKWSGRQLTSDSFVQLMEEAHAQRQTAMDALYADSTEMNAVFNGWLNSGKINQAQREQLNDLWTYNLMNMEGESMGRALAFGTNTLMDTYGDLINENLGRIENNGDASGTINTLSEMATSGEWDFARAENAFASNRNFYSLHGEGREALLEVYESMKPDIADMSSLIDTYRQQGLQIPTALMSAFNQAIEVGAAAGDIDAGWQNYANWLWESGSEELKDTLSNPANPMYETLRHQMPEELQNALDRTIYAAENSVESADLSEMFNALLGLSDPNMEIDLARLSELCEKYGLDISGYLEEKGIDIEANPKLKLSEFSTDEVAAAIKQIEGLDFSSVVGDMAHFTIGEDAPTVWNIAESLVPDAANNQARVSEISDAIVAANEAAYEQAGKAFDPTKLVSGEDIIVPAEFVVDEEKLHSSVGEAANEMVSAAEQVAEAAQAAADAEDSTVTYTQDTTVTPGDTDTSEMRNAAEKASQDEFDNPITADGKTDVTLTEDDNVLEIYNTVGEKVDAAFANDYSASATVNVTLTANYSLANPTKTITFDGGAEGNATVTAHLALGGLISSPTIAEIGEAGYPEYVIPIDGSDRSRDMWAEAGSMLGVMDKPIETMPEGSGSVSRGSNEASQQSKDINLNINGSGTMRVQSNASKEDILTIVMENVKDILMDIIQNDILVEGDGAYEY